VGNQSKARAVMGVQPKLSLDIEKWSEGDRAIKTPGAIYHRWSVGCYIIPGTKQYPRLLEVEDLTIHLAALPGIATVCR
jgi:serine/threonine-protein kinase HipA